MSPADPQELVPTSSDWVPAWLGPQDYPWLEALLDELRRFEGRTLREWRARSAEPLRAPCPPGRQRRVAALLSARCAAEPAPLRPAPRERRLAVFLEAQRRRDAGAFDRGAVLAAVAEPLRAAPESLAEALYADVPSERRIALGSAPADAPALALESNLALAQGLLRSSGSLEIDLGGGSRAVVRQILLKRLLCTVRPAAAGVRIEVSGPLALFRHTALYGRALASIVPTLRGADRFTIRARLALRGRPRTVRIASGDPIFPPGAAPQRFDSKLEERFARDFARAATDWDVVREPEPIAVDGTWIFPDFALVDRRDPARRWLLEIVGYWTEDYLESKLERLRRAGRADLILCLDSRFAGPKAPLPQGSPAVLFHRRIDVRAIRRILDAQAPRRVAAPPDASIWERIGLQDLFLDFAGRRAPEDPIHARLRRMRVGDEVDLAGAGGGIVVRNAEGEAIAALSARASERWAARIGRVRRARVVERFERSASQSAAFYRAKLRVERWWVPVIEVELAQAQVREEGWTYSDQNSGSRPQMNR